MFATSGCLQRIYLQSQRRNIATEQNHRQASQFKGASIHSTAKVPKCIPYNATKAVESPFTRTAQQQNHMKLSPRMKVPSTSKTAILWLARTFAFAPSDSFTFIAHMLREMLFYRLGHLKDARAQIIGDRKYTQTRLDETAKHDVALIELN